ncbi:MAG TPA: hypothetical protein VFW75_04590, partial [Acetobacteraceae bacterium]|nr:hypothetical protein [Acetobacteraceae bacterium]
MKLLAALAAIVLIETAYAANYDGTYAGKETVTANHGGRCNDFDAQIVVTGGRLTYHHASNTTITVPI